MFHYFDHKLCRLRDVLLLHVFHLERLINKLCILASSVAAFEGNVLCEFKANLSNYHQCVLEGLRNNSYIHNPQSVMQAFQTLPFIMMCALILIY